MAILGILVHYIGNSMHQTRLAVTVPVSHMLGAVLRFQMLSHYAIIIKWQFQKRSKRLHRFSPICYNLRAIAYCHALEGSLCNAPSHMFTKKGGLQLLRATSAS